jgi:hypothetical protein
MGLDSRDGVRPDLSFGLLAFASEQARVGLVDQVGWADPDAVADADVAVVRQ